MVEPLSSWMIITVLAIEVCVVIVTISVSTNYNGLQTELLLYPGRVITVEASIPSNVHASRLLVFLDC